MPTHARCLLLLFSALMVTTGCEPDPTPDALRDAAPAPLAVAPDTIDDGRRAEPAPNDEKAQTLSTALDSLEAFVVVLERIEGPVAAWNEAPEAARLLGYMNEHRTAFDLGMPEDSAVARYPTLIARARRLEERRAAALDLIEEDRATSRVLFEEIAKAEAEAKAP